MERKKEREKERKKEGKKLHLLNVSLSFLSVSRKQSISVWTVASVGHHDWVIIKTALRLNQLR